MNTLVMSQCVCVRIYLRTPKYKGNTDNIPIFLHVENNAPSQETSALHRLAEPPQPLSPPLLNKLCIHERMCTPCGECVCKYEG